MNHKEEKLSFIYGDRFCTLLAKPEIVEGGYMFTMDRKVGVFSLNYFCIKVLRVGVIA